MPARVPADLVAAALSAARARDADVADVPLNVIAATAGISRSTLLRRLGGTRVSLDEAVRAAGVDPGGRRPVRERALAAAAHLISDHGLGALTLAAVADTAGCSLPSVHAVFDGRDGLLDALFDAYSPTIDLEKIGANPPDRIDDTITAIYRALLAAFAHEPAVLPALFADAFARPHGPGRRVLVANFPRLLGSVGGVLAAEVDAGRLRPYPVPLLAQLLLGPLIAHLMSRPVLREVPDVDLPSIDEACATFAEAFLRATRPDT